MSRFSKMASVAAFMMTCLAGTTLRPLQAKDMGPDLSFDFRAMISEHLELINSGQAAKAAEFLCDHSHVGNIGNTGFYEELKKAFSGIYGSSGKFEAYEVFGYKQISPRSVSIDVLVHYEHRVMYFRYGLENKDNKWGHQSFSYTDKLDEIEREVPFQRLADSESVKTQSVDDPKLGFDFRGLLNEHLKLINAGEAEKAANLILKRTKQGELAVDRIFDFLKTKFGLFHETLGKYSGSEISGYKQVSQRCVYLYVINHYEKAMVQITYGFVYRNGEWKLLHINFTDNGQEMSRNVPFVRLMDK
jgi:hypothetical protein